MQPEPSQESTCPAASAHADSAVTGSASCRLGGGHWLPAFRLALAGLVLLSLALRSFGVLAATPPGPEQVDIRRTTDGIPHVKASSWRGLGQGIGYVQAQDALCTLAEAFTTYEGRRSYHFGADARPERESSFGRARNLELDFFFKAFADDAMVARYRAEQPPELLAAVEGYAQGYNRQLADARRSGGTESQRRCLHEDWVHEIRADDLFRRFYAAQVAAGTARFIPEIVGAAPEAPPVAAVGGGLAQRLAHRVGDQDALGSNMMALGRQATGDGGSVLLGNPHWYWGGPDRFYQMHLTLPGQLDVAGVSFLGVPLVMIGFNRHVAWSNTVSTARRFGLFDLLLAGGEPTAYQVDGERRPMTSQVVSVTVRGVDGQPTTLTRRLYRSAHGPVLNLAAHDPAFGWGQGHAISLRDANAENFRVFRTFLAWDRARSLDEFIAIQRRELAMPWVNTVAIDATGRVWYADIGPVPNVPDALRARCLTPRAQGFAQVDPATPMLDGSRSECDWQSDPTAPQAGILPVSALPSLLRNDEVANMNDSHWLASPAQPLEGFASVIGGERQALSLRARRGHQMAVDLAARPHGGTQALAAELRVQALAAVPESARRYRAALWQGACGGGQTVRMGAGDAAREVDPRAACAVLSAWSGLADAEGRGALLWERFWFHWHQSAPPEALFEQPFSADAPLDTPAHPVVKTAALALAQAQDEMQAQGLDLAATTAGQRLVQTGTGPLPVFGGCDDAGHFATACNDDGSLPMGPNSSANSYLQVVSLGPQGLQAHTLLAHGLDEGAVIGLGGAAAAAPVQRYVRRAWLAFPFTEQQIQRDPQLRHTVLTLAPAAGQQALNSRP